jgi:hypothetical protein
MQTNLRLIVLLFVLIAVAKVCLLALLTPEFYLCDELFHFDNITHYARLEVPRRAVHFSVETTQYAGAPFYNHESLEPPLYYAIGALWHIMGQSVFGTFGRPLDPRWDRFLSAVLAAATVWLGFLVARRIFPPGWRQLLVPAFLAAIPQLDLCGVSNDTLPPVVAGLGLLSLLMFRDKPSFATAACVGLSISALLMSKATTLPLAGVACGSYLLLVVVKRSRVSLGGFAVGVVPVIAWAVWNKSTLDDWTGAGIKLQLLGFTPKPMTAWLSHELFTFHGARLFWWELMASFWRGELTLPQHRDAWVKTTPVSQIAPQWWDLYFVLIATFVIATIVPLIRREKTNRQFGLWVCFAGFIASAAFLAFSSVYWTDKHQPGMTAWLGFIGFANGRLMSGALILFAVLLAEAVSQWISVIQIVTGGVLPHRTA